MLGFFASCDQIGESMDIMSSLTAPTYIEFNPLSKFECDRCSIDLRTMFRFSTRNIHVHGQRVPRLLEHFLVRTSEKPLPKEGINGLILASGPGSFQANLEVKSTSICGVVLRFELEGQINLKI